MAVGTGVGGALILDGQVWRGRTCTAGEIAHVLVDWQGGRLCNCGQPGHLEAYAAGPAMAARYVELAGGSVACDLREVHALARAGDVQAQAAIAEGATILGKALCGLVDTLDLDAIVIGGGVPALGELWWEPLLATLRANPMPGPRANPSAAGRAGRRCRDCRCGHIGTGAAGLCRFSQPENGTRINADERG